MNASEQTPLTEGSIPEDQPEPSLRSERRPTWSGELRRRTRHLRQLIEAEEAHPSLTEPWRLKLIQRALFSTWLDRRDVMRTRRSLDRVA